MCVHDNFHISDCNSFNTYIFGELCRDFEGFPNIGKNCTKHCKKKMAKIVEITMKQFTDIAINYYKDSKLGKESSAYSYILYCRGPRDDDEEVE
ncbi:hypothetical protein DICPUDRAFT_13674, partial [Dictyostelium purpureum]